MLGVILAVFVACFLLERLRPGWRLPASRGWWWRVLAINGVQIGVVTIAGFTWERWARSASLWHLGGTLPAWTGGALAYFIATFVFYWWHRARHEVHWLWLGFHQIHHSPARLEVITSFYKHPIEMTVNSLIGSVLVYGVLGLNPAGGAIYTLFTALGEFFYHTNVRTPRWIGFIFQRPEMHASTTNTSAIATTMATSCGGTCCLELGRTRQPGMPAAATMRGSSSDSAICFSIATSTPGRAPETRTMDSSRRTSGRRSMAAFEARPAMHY